MPGEAPSVFTSILSVRWSHSARIRSSLTIQLMHISQVDKRRSKCSQSCVPQFLVCHQKSLQTLNSFAVRSICVWCDGEAARDPPVSCCHYTNCPRSDSQHFISNSENYNLQRGQYCDHQWHQWHGITARPMSPGTHQHCDTLIWQHTGKEKLFVISSSASQMWEQIFWVFQLLIVDKYSSINLHQNERGIW